jgi:hypothetical protein
MVPTGEDRHRPVPHAAGQPDRVHRRRQRFDQRRRRVVQVVRHDVQAARVDGEGLRHATLRGAAAEEAEPLAEVLPAGPALLAGPARQIGLHDGTPAGLDRRHVRRHRRDDPTTSCPGAYGGCTLGCRPRRAWVSEPQTPATTIRSWASPGPGSGVSTSTIRTPSGSTTTRIMGLR